MKKLKNLLKEGSGTTVGYGLNTGDAWPDGLFTKYGERRLITPAGMPRGMKQLVAPAADSIYGGDGTQREKMDMEKNGTMKKTKITPEYVKSNEVIDPHELRDDTPPLAPNQRVYGRRAFGKSPNYTIPRESANFVTSAENVLVRPTTPPEGTESGGIPATPEPNSQSAGSRSGYKQLQKGGENLIQGKDLDKMYIYKMLGQYDPKKEGLREHILKVLLEAGSLPLKLKSVKKHSDKKIKRQADGGVSDDFFKHHKYHSGAHLTGKGAEHATYDFDDSDYDVEGGYQDRKNKQKRGYEPVESVKEGNFSKIMKSVRRGPKSGPWTIIITKNNKITKQVSVKNLKEIPAEYEDIKKRYPNHKIGIEAKDGRIVYREAYGHGFTRNELAMYLIDLNSLIKQVKNPKHLKMLKQDIKDVKKALAKKKKESMKEGISDKMSDIMSKLAKSMGIKSVVSMHTGKGSLSYFIDDKMEAKKLSMMLKKTFKRVRLIPLDKSKGDTANFVVAADMLGLESVVETIKENICIHCGNPSNENLRKWFSDKWVNIGKKKKGGGHPPCGSSGKKRGYAKCVPKSKAANMSKKQKASATRRKRSAQNKKGRGGTSSLKGGGKKPIYVSTKPKK